MTNKIIVMVGNTAWSMFQFRADIISAFIKQGNRVLVVTPKDEFSSELQKLGCEWVELDVERKGLNPFKDFIYMTKLAEIFINARPDIVLNYTIKPVLYGSIAARLANVKKIIAITTGLGYIFSHDNLVSKMAKFLYKWSLKFADQVWFLNGDDEQIFIREKIISPKKSFILPGEGVNTDYYAPITRESSGNSFTLISRMLWEKGVGLFVECAEEIRHTFPEATFQLVGPVDSGNPEAISSDQLSRWHKSGAINYLGSLKDIRPVLEKTTCLVHPTYYKEGLPRILMEACSMGIPCITTDTSGCRDVIIPHKNGFLTKPNSKEALKEALLSFMHTGPEERKRLGSEARKRMVENFSSDKIIQIYFEKLSLI